MIAVTGATGWLGKAICGSLAQSGTELRPLARRPVASAALGFDLGASVADGMWVAAVRDCDTVIHAAAHVHRPRETADEVRLFDAINVDGTRKLLAAAERAGVRRFVYVSSSAVYGSLSGQAPDEHAELAPQTHYGRSKAAAEKAVRSSQLDWIIVRPATIFGMGDRANFARLAVALRRGRFVVPGNGAARKSVLPVSLAGELIAECAVRPFPSGTVLNLALPEAPTLREICDTFSAQCDWPVARSVPLGVFKIGARIGDAFATVGARVPLTTSTLAKLTTDTVVDTRALVRMLPRENWPSFGDALHESAGYYVSA